MQVQLTFSEQGSDAALGAVSNQNDSAHRGEAGGGERSRDSATNMLIRVQLQDSSGGVLRDATPNSDGQVSMVVCPTGSYRLRVTGSAIEEAIVEDLQPGRGDKLVNVELHRKGTKEPARVQKSTVSAKRLGVPKKAQKQLDKGDKALKQGKLDVAQSYYTKAIAIYPQFEEAENNLGIALMRAGQKPEGRAAFERAIAMDEHYAPAFLNLAKIAFDEKRFNNAHALATQALKSEPFNTGALFITAESAFFKGEYGEAISYARTLHSLPHKQFALVHFLAARSLEAEHHTDEAVTEYQTFLEEDPADPNAARARELLALLQASATAERMPGSQH